MAWSDEQWDMFVTVLRRGFVARDPFTDADARVYRLLLDDVDPDAALRAVKALILNGQELRPRPGAIVAATRRDPGKPTFDEAFELIFGSAGVLAAQPTGRRWAHDGERRAAYRQAAIERASRLHPLVYAFVARQDIDRLRRLPIHDEAWGEKRRADLERAWNEHVETWDGREVAALASGERLGLQKFDPLAALGRAGIPVPRPELEETTS